MNPVNDAYISGLHEQLTCHPLSACAGFNNCSAGYTGVEVCFNAFDWLSIVKFFAERPVASTARACVSLPVAVSLVHR